MTAEEAEYEYSTQLEQDIKDYNNLIMEGING